MLRKLFAAAFAGRAFCSRRPRAQETIVVYFQKGFYPAEDKAVDELVEKFTEEDRREGGAVALRAAGNDPEDGGRARLRHAARHGVRRRVRLPGRRQVGVRGPPRGPVRHPHADEGQVPAEHARNHLHVQRQGRRSAPTTRSRSSARPCTSSTGRTCWPRRASRNRTSRRPGRPTSTSGAARCRRATARRPASASTRSAARWASTRPTRSTRSSPTWTATTSSW